MFLSTGMGSLQPPPWCQIWPHQLQAGAATQPESVAFIRPGDLVVRILGLQLLCSHRVVRSPKALAEK